MGLSFFTLPSSAQIQTPAELESGLAGAWLVTVAGEARTRLLKIAGATQKSDGTFILNAAYGYSDGKQSPIRAEITHDQKLTFMTGADSLVVATRPVDDTFLGTITYKNGKTIKVTIAKVSDLATQVAPVASGQPATKIVPSAPVSVHLIWMGGNDCPPCVYWRGSELPKLEKTEVFKTITFSYVIKSVQSAVPSRLFLPDNVKPLKEKLDAANNGRDGSPQYAIVVNGEVFDYYLGGEISAAKMEKMLLAARDGTRYPGDRCVKLINRRGSGCLVKG